MPAYQELISDVYSDFLSKTGTDINNPGVFLSKVEDALNTVEDYDSCFDPYKYAIAMQIMEEVSNDEFQELSLDERCEASEMYLWMPKEFDELDDDLMMVSEYALAVYTGEEEVGFELAQKKLFEMTEKFDEMWRKVPQMQSKYGDHFYLTDLLSERENDFYADFDVIMRGDISNISANLAFLLESRGVDVGISKDVSDMVEEYSDLAEFKKKLKAEGYDACEVDGELEITEGYGINSFGLLN